MRLGGAIICEGQADVQRSSSWVRASVNSLLVTADYKYLRFRSSSVFSPAQNNHSPSGIEEEQLISSVVLWPRQRALSSWNLTLVVNLSLLFLVKSSQWGCLISFRIRLCLGFWAFYISGSTTWIPIKPRGNSPLQVCEHWSRSCSRTKDFLVSAPALPTIHLNLWKFERGFRHVVLVAANVTTSLHRLQSSGAASAESRQLSDFTQNLQRGTSYNWEVMRWLTREGKKKKKKKTFCNSK